MEGINADTALWALFFSAFLSSTLLPGSSEALLITFVTQGYSSHALLLLAATSGNTLGGMSSWLLGYWIAWRKPAWSPEQSAHQVAVQRIRHWGWPILLFSWLPVIGDPLCLAAGWLKINGLLSFVAILIGKALRYALLIYLIQ